MTTIGTHRDVLWHPAAADPARVALDIETGIDVALNRNSRLYGHRVRETAGADGVVTLTGAVSTQALRKEVELSC